MAHLLSQPYEKEYLNRIEFLSLMTSFVTFFMGQLLYLDTSGSTVTLLVSTSIAVVNLLFFGVCIVAISRSVKETIHRLQRRDRVRQTKEILKIRSVHDVHTINK